MTSRDMSATNDCIFCEIVAGHHIASVVYRDDLVIAFMDRYPVTRGHLLVVPHTHAAGLEELDEATSSHVWTVGHRLARALRRSELPCEGINMLLCDGEAAFQTVFHFHLHVIPRYRGDSWNAVPESGIERERDLLYVDAGMIRNSLSRPTPHASETQ